MLRKTLLISLILVMVFTTFAPAFADTLPLLDTSKLASGTITVNVDSENEFRVMVSKDTERKVHTLFASTNLSLSMGDGTYAIRIYEKINGRFTQRLYTTVDLVLQDDKALYLGSVQNINWNGDMVAIQKAAELTEGLETQQEKIEAIYNFVISSVTYDYAKARDPGGNYLPDIDATLESGTGICYDYSSLFAAMLRSVGVPTKLTVGHVGSLYHAWNQVYLSETDEWVTVDTTNDALYHQYGLNTQMIKTSPMYDVEIMY